MHARAAFIVACVVVSGCRCSDRVEVPQSGLTVSPVALDFGHVPMGQRVGLRLSVTNRGRIAREVAVEVALPFQAATLLAVPGGATEDVEVVFVPVELGPVVGALRLTSEGEVFDVQLVANAGAACEARPCHEARFDALTGACTEVVSADSTPCEAACLLDATCRAGVCVGAATSCDDGNACTADACSADGGCEHFAVECPVTSACQVAFCDAQRGCASRDVEDGVLCGATTCEFARVCITGQCVERRRPNADLFCRFTDVVSVGQATCGLTRSGARRCWGRWLNPPDWNLLSGPNVSPGFEADVTRIFASPRCALVAGELRCSDLDGGFVTSPAVVDIQRSFFGQSTFVQNEHGAVSLLEADGGSTLVADAGVIRMAARSNSVCLLWGDGGVDCGGAHVPIAEPVVDLVTSRFTVCGLTNVGGVSCWPTVDAGLPAHGAIALGGLISNSLMTPDVCWAEQGGVVSCLTQQPFLPPKKDTWRFPAEVTRLTRGGSGHVCALLEDGRVLCVGSNADANLGDRSMQPEGMHEVPISGVDSLQVFNSGALAVVDGGLWGWGQVIKPGELSSLTLPVAFPAPFGRARAVAANADVHCAQDETDAIWCWSDSAWGTTQPIIALPSAVHAASFGVSSNGVAAWMVAVDTQGSVWRWADSSPTSHGQQGRGRAVSAQGLLIAEDGTLRMTSGQVRQVEGQCALLEDGSVECWNESVLTAGVETARIEHLAPGVRLVAGSLRSGCAVSGQNGLQCWGTNRNGGLGRDGPPSIRPVSLSVNEPIDSLKGGHNLGPFCVVLRSKKVRCWGENSAGQLGFLPLGDSTQPLPID